jgi:hypothetical protein
MAKAYITTTAATQVVVGYSKEVLVQINADLVGTIKVIDGTTGTTANVATITNPLGGSFYTYRDLAVGVRIIASATCDITVSADTRL